MFDGVDSPVTQTFGLGLFDPVSAIDLDRVENFFRERGAPVFHEVSPLADPEIFTLLNERGYHRSNLRASYIVRFNATCASQNFATIRSRCDESKQMRLKCGRKPRPAGGASIRSSVTFMLNFGRVAAHREEGLSFVAELDGKAIATGMMTIHEGVALLAGASTVPEGRKQGAQLALLDSRLRYAVEHGCNIATMGALPGSPSQRNAERQGFASPTPKQVALG
jgi:hypothetical protein